LIPDEVLLPLDLGREIMDLLAAVLHERAGHTVKVRFATDSAGHRVLDMANTNAKEHFLDYVTKSESKKNALEEIRDRLKLPAVPDRIECYDISNTQGTASVGSMVVFEQGTPAKNLYRKFNIDSTSIGAPDDFASMEEMLTRRFKRWRAAQETEAGPGSKPDASFSFLPDLIIIDGGKGQLGRVVKVLEEFDLFDKVPVVGLAKQEEEIFFPHNSVPLLLPRHSQGLYLVQRIRDEAHRYGITAHRARRSKQGLASQLDSVPGIGPTRRKALLKHFGSMDKIKEASLEELAAVKGMSGSAAESVKAHLE